MRLPLRLHLLPAGLLLAATTLALAVEAAGARPGQAVLAILPPGQRLALPEEWRLRRVVLDWPFLALLLDRVEGAGPADAARLRAAAGTALLLPLPAGTDCLPAIP